VLQVNDAVDGLADELQYLRDQVSCVDCIAVIPADIQDQISDNRVCIFWSVCSLYFFILSRDIRYILIFIDICSSLT